MLRHEMPTIQYAAGEPVTQFFKRLANHAKRPAPIVRQQVLDVLKQESPRAFRRNDPRDIEEQRALGRALEAMGASERILLRHSRKTERLTRKTADQNVVIRHGRGLDFRDIAGNLVIVGREISAIGLPRVIVPLAREDAPAAHGLGAEAHASDTGEEIDKSETGRAQ